MKNKKSIIKLSSVPIAALKSFIIFLFVFMTVFPFIYMVSISLSSQEHVLANDVYLYPKGITFRNYLYVLSDERIYTAYMNTLIYVVFGTALSLALTSLGAYALCQNEIPFRRFFRIMMIICLFFDGGMIPAFLVVKWLGLINTRWAVILPRAIIVWYFFVMMSLFSSIPKELIDSARMDGIKDFGAFWYIALPLSKAALATIGLFYGVRIWNEFRGPLLYLNDHELYPLTIILRDMVVTGIDMVQSGPSVEEGTFVTPQSLKFATLIVSVVPIMCVYPFLQKYFVKGAMIGALKG